MNEIRMTAVESVQPLRIIERHSSGGRRSPPNPESAREEASGEISHDESDTTLAPDSTNSSPRVIDVFA